MPALNTADARFLDRVALHLAPAVESGAELTPDLIAAGMRAVMAADDATVGDLYNHTPRGEAVRAVVTRGIWDAVRAEVSP